MINRGLAKRPLFERREDARFFLARLVRQIRLGRIEVHAYCLLTTHFHLLVRSPVGELSEAMRRAQNEHSRRFNRRHRRDGALIRGVFFSRPVETLAYRRTLVRYIDANPVRAGLVRSAEEYELGSAAAYLGGTVPRWLSRGWVEAEARDGADVEAFTPAAYRATFGCVDPAEREELHDFLEARMASRGTRDPLEDLIGTTPTEVQAWMRRKTKLADGGRPGLPVCGRLALRRAIDAHVAAEGPWMVEDGRRTWRGAELAWFGLSRDLCCSSWTEIARTEDGSVARARRLWKAHRRLLEQNPPYAQRAATLTRTALDRVIRSGSPYGTAATG